MELILIGTKFLFSNPMAIVLMAAGVFGGIVFGCIPGLTATLGVTLMIPFTYSLEPVLGLSMLIGIYVGGISGGLITAILINIPGTPSSIATCWDGYPLATKKGKPGLALSIGVFSSLFGGLVSAFMLILIAPQLAAVALKFGPWEYCALALMGLSVVVALTGKDPVKGLMGACIGLLIGTVGTDPLTGVSRLTFGFWQMTAGIEATALMMGFFAINEMLQQTWSLGQQREKLKTTGLTFKPPMKELKGARKTMIVGSFIGTYVGILPGIGQNTAAILTYNWARQSSKHPELFGTGIAEGIVASEVSNNAVNGGALIPMMTLGIPGDMVTAALMGGLMIHGMQPGPLLFRNQAQLMGALMVAYFLANIVMYIFELGFMQVFVRAVDVPTNVLFPPILVCCLLGVYSINNRVFNIWVLIISGILGYIVTQMNIPMPPMILGFLLGGLVELNFRTAVMLFGGKASSIFGRPIALVLIIVGILFAAWPSLSGLRMRKKREREAASKTES